tara:strand:- start:3467 stop:3856 length:390 start_codon:yes stop_codon:yes gene_type:complete
MAIYATGAKSQAICERCGFRIPYQQLTTEWNGLRVCPECWDPKHPQLTPRTVADAQAIYQPRPGTNSREDASPRILSGVSSSTAVGYCGCGEISSAPVSGLSSATAVGTVALEITGWGNSGWGSAGFGD